MQRRKYNIKYNTTKIDAQRLYGLLLYLLSLQFRSATEGRYVCRTCTRANSWDPTTKTQTMMATKVSVWALFLGHTTNKLYFKLHRLDFYPSCKAPCAKRFQKIDCTGLPHSCKSSHSKTGSKNMIYWQFPLRYEFSLDESGFQVTMKACEGLGNFHFDVFVA